jgi:hypothetical protein
MALSMSATEEGYDVRVGWALDTIRQLASDRAWGSESSAEGQGSSTGAGWEDTRELAEIIRQATRTQLKLERVS